MKLRSYLVFVFLFAFVFASKAQVDQAVVTCAKGTALGTNSYSIAITDAKCIIPPIEKDGIEVGMIPSIANTGASTLKLNGWTARSIKKNGAALISGDLVANVYYIMKYNATTTCWDMIGGGGGSGFEPSITPGTTAQYWRGDKTWQDFNTAARNSISLTTTGISGAATYTASTGVLNIPNYSLGASQWTTSGSNIYYNTGNVGINNSAPTARLDVVGTSTVYPAGSFSTSVAGSPNASGVEINVDGAYSNNGLLVNAKSTVPGSTNNSIIAIADAANSGNNNGIASIAENGDYNTAGNFYANGGIEATAMTLKAEGASSKNNALVTLGGRAGFGTASPSALVHIEGSSGSLVYKDGSQGSGKVLTSDANGVSTWQTPTAGGVQTVTATSPLSASGTTTTTISLGSVVPLNLGGTNANNTAPSGTVLRGNATQYVPSTYTISNTFTSGSILHATSSNTVGENTSFGFNGNQMYMGTTTPSTDHGIDLRWNNNAATFWRFYNPSTGTSSRSIIRVYNQSYVLDMGVNGINYTNNGLLRSGSPFILFNAPTNENGLIYTSSTNGLIFAIGGTSSSNAKMYLDGTNGFVGIGTGTVAATAPLHVTGSTRALQISSTATTVATRPLMVINSAGDTILQLNSRGCLQIGNNEENLYSGTYSGLKNTTGIYNTTHGRYNLAFQTTGSYNTAGGHGSQYKMTTGSGNSSYAVNTLYNDTSGSYNGAFGMESQNQNRSGSYCNSFGYTSSFRNKTGNYNNAFGHAALFENLGSGNLALGSYAGYYGTWNNMFFLDNQDRTDSTRQISKSLLVGYFGTDSSVQQLRLNGRIRITGGSYGNGKVLTSDATGLASWQTLTDAAADGTTKGVATFTASDFNSSSGNISIDYTNGQSASGSTKGFLTSADWTTFSNKQAALTFVSPLSVTSNTVSIPGGTSGRILRDDGANFVASAVTWPNSVGSQNVLYATGSNAIGSSGNFTYNGSTVRTDFNANSVNTGFQIVQSNSGSSAAGIFQISNGTNVMNLYHTSTGYTTSGVFAASTAALYTDGGGGIALSAAHATTGKIKFGIGSSNAEIARIDATGLGVGVTPALKFEVLSSGVVARFNSSNGNTAQISLGSSTGTNHCYIGGTSGSNFMTFDGSGNEMSRQNLTGLGIGTSSPQSKLDVEGGAAIGATYSGTTAAPTNGLIVEGKVGIGQSSPTSILHLKAGTATANTAPLKFTSGTNLTTPEDGAVEYDGTNYSASVGSTRYTLVKALTGSATLDFPSTSPNSYNDLTITVTGASVGDVVSLGPGVTPGAANTSFFSWVSATNTVTVRFNNADAVTTSDPGSATFKVVVIK